MLRGSTLAETLVMMLVAGIVFLATMEALTLVSRLVARRAAVLVEAGRQRDGIFRLGQLLTTGRQHPQRRGRRHRRAAVPLSCRRRDDTDDARLRGSIRRGGVPRYGSCVVSGTCSSYAATRRPIPSKSTSGAIC